MIRGLTIIIVASFFIVGCGSFPNNDTPQVSFIDRTKKEKESHDYTSTANVLSECRINK